MKTLLDSIIEDEVVAAGLDAETREAFGAAYQPEGETARPSACNADPLVLSCFDSYKTSLKPWHHEQLDRITIEIVGGALDGKPVTHILLIGHAADWKTSDPKLSLGWGRAMSVATALRSRLKGHSADIAGIPIIPMSLGDVVPAASNATQAGRRLNRRVTVKLLRVPPPKKIKCTPLADEPLGEVVESIFGRSPKEFDVAKELYSHIQRADTEVCKRLGKLLGIEARLACMFFNSFVETVSNEFKDEPEAQLAFVRGAAYALMDAATNRRREALRQQARQDPFIIKNATVTARLKVDPARLERYVQAFEQGYGHIQGRLLVLRRDTSARQKLDEALAAIGCRENRVQTLRRIYLNILRVIRSEVTSIRGNAFISSAGNCALGYPTIRATDCSPLPD